MKKDKLGKILLNNPIPLFLIIFGFAFLLSIKIIPSSFIFGKLLLIPLVLLISEFILRILLIFNYGLNYIYRFKPFFLIDDNKYGFKFKKNYNSKKLPFPLYERYLFPANVVIPVEKNLNLLKRISFSTDINGFRNNDLILKNNISSKLKIICSGGSTTAGQGINNNETWPSKLQSELNKKGILANVINAGVYGYDSFQELENLKYNLIKQKPDCLIIHQGWNEEFEFSALGAGKRFRAKHARKYFEKWYFFSNNIPFFPRKYLSAILILRYIRRILCLKKNMSFTKKIRWEVLLNDQYLKNWYDNIFQINEVCKKNNIRLFITNYPCLVNIDDSSNDRKIYVDNSRLNNNFASYQAFSKARINEFFKLISQDFDILDGSHSFKKYRGLKRLELFSDEIHLSAKGEQFLAEGITKELLKYINHDQLEKNSVASFKKSTRKIENDNFQKYRRRIGLNSKMLNIEIRKYISSKLEIDKSKEFEISTDIYTTS